MRKLSNTVATKEYVPNTLGNSFTFNNLFASKHFSLIFVTLTSISNTKVKCVLFLMTATGCFNVKDCSKTIMKMHLLELLHFCEIFTFVVILSNVVNLLNKCRCLMTLICSQCERYLINFVI